MGEGKGKEKVFRTLPWRGGGEGAFGFVAERSIGNWVGAWRSEGRGAVAKAKGFNSRKQNHKSMYGEVKSRFRIHAGLRSRYGS